MRIENIRSYINNDMFRVSASLIWEDSQRQDREVYFETDKKFADFLAPDPHAFLVGCILPAMYLGEKRIKINEKICPMLIEGLITNMEFFRYWYGEKYKPVLIETDGVIEYQIPDNNSRKVASFLSGGIDSLFTLRMNRLRYSTDNPASIQYCLMVHGFDIYYDEQVDKKLDYFNLAIDALKKITTDAKVNLIPVYTNIRHLYSDVPFWIKWFHGAALSAVAHATSKKNHSVLIASSNDIPGLHPMGSHPTIDSNYSSYSLRIIHDGVRFSRFEKTKVVAEWETALNNLRVCVSNKDGLLNCGLCEKCRRTMLALVALGKLKDSKAFPYAEISSSGIKINKKILFSLFYRELIDPLKEKKRFDLVKAIYREMGIFGDIRRFDKKFLRNILEDGWMKLSKLIKVRI